MTKEQIEEQKRRIDRMSQGEMAYVWRFAPMCHPYFDKRNGDLAEYFKARFKELGGFPPEISKRIGWGR